MRKCLQLFFQPYRWQSSSWEPSQHIKLLCLVTGFFIISSVSNSKWEFPHFHLYFGTFTIVLLGAVYSETHYTRQFNRIRAQTAKNSGFITANTRYTKLEQSNIVGIIAVAVVAVFGIGGVSIYGAIAVTPTLILCLVYFSVVVYLSIVGYVQYIVLFTYIFCLAADKEEFKNVGQELADTLPAEINWLRNLIKLTHFYRTIFFTVGAFYIAAFWFYCSSPKFAVALGHWIHYVLWAIIFIAIVVVFPLVSIIEFQLIKNLVAKVKRAYISEVKLGLETIGREEKPEAERRVLSVVFSSSILQSANYPIPNRAGIAYAIALAMLNLIGSIDTAIQLGKQLLIF